MDLAPLKPLQDRLEHHPVYAAVSDLPTLRVFMEHHVYSVWDFMSLLKALQQHAAPAAVPWLPGGNGSVQRFINEIVWQEESDEVPADGGVQYLSHFEMYLAAMREVGAEVSAVELFLDLVRSEGIQSGLQSGVAPAPANEFMRGTFAVLDEGAPHAVAASFALGREQVIPRMFRTLLDQMGIGADEAPMFRYYLQRHMELDDEAHGPMAGRMLESLCGGDPVKEAHALAAAQRALEARIAFWDALHGRITGV